MKAIVYYQYGTPAKLRLAEIDPPTPQDHEVLVKVHATAVNSWDWDMLTGTPYLFRLVFGIFKPRQHILGADVAGEVVAVGSQVTGLRAGDAVFGDLGERFGGFAEYVCAPADCFIPKPPALSYAQAAAIPQTAVLAWQALTYQGPLQPGQQVLLNGAGGGVGTFALQLAKRWGAEVTVVDHADKLPMLDALGADHLIDYTRQDFASQGQRYDLLIDVVGRRSVFAYQRCLKPGGALVLVGGTPGVLLQTALLGPALGRLRGVKLGILIHRPNLHLAEITELCATGALQPIIDRLYPLEETPAALQYLGDARVQGKVVVMVTPT